MTQVAGPTTRESADGFRHRSCEGFHAISPRSIARTDSRQTLPSPDHGESTCGGELIESALHPGANHAINFIGIRLGSELVP